MAAKVGLFVDEDHSKLPTLYWLPKLHKRPYKSRFIANSSACTTLFVLFVCFVALRPKSTAMVIAGRSVHLTTLFPGQA